MPGFLAPAISLLQGAARAAPYIAAGARRAASDPMIRRRLGGAVDGADTAVQIMDMLVGYSGEESNKTKAPTNSSASWDDTCPKKEGE